MADELPVSQTFGRMRSAIKNWYTIGFLAAIVLQSRIPPHRGLAGTWLARRVVTFRMRDGSRVKCRLQDAGDVVSVYVDQDYAGFDLRWDEIRTIVDIGATVGCFTLWVVKRAPQARVVAVEPNPNVYPFLIDNIAQNELTNRVVAMPAALGAKAGHATVIDSSFSTLARAVPDPNPSPSSMSMVTLQDVLNEAGLDECDLLKVDCEGCEYDILLGTSDVVLGRIDTIVCEFHPIPGQSLEELSDRLERAGFVVRTVGGPVGFLVARRHRL